MTNASSLDARRDTNASGGAALDRLPGQHLSPLQVFKPCWACSPSYLSAEGETSPAAAVRHKTRRCARRGGHFPAAIPATVDPIDSRAIDQAAPVPRPGSAPIALDPAGEYIGNEPSPASPRTRTAMNTPSKLSRRDLLDRVLPAAAVLWAVPRSLGRAAEAEQLPPLRQITHGPKHHWFGYYDKLEFDPTGRFVLGNEVDFEHRSPKPDDEIRVGMIDLGDGDRWIELGRPHRLVLAAGVHARNGGPARRMKSSGTTARPAAMSATSSTSRRQRHTIPHPLYAVSPDGRWAVAPDFRRLGVMRPGYGYNGIPDPYAEQRPPRGRHLADRPGDRPQPTAAFAGRYCQDSLPRVLRMRSEPRHAAAAAADFGPANTGSTTCWSIPTARGSSSSIAGKCPRPKAGRRGCSRPRRRLRSARRRRLRRDVAFHLARSAAHPGLVDLRKTGRLLPLRGPDARHPREGADDRRWPLHLSARQALDPQRHLSRPATESEPVSIPPRTGRRVPLGHFLLPKEYAGEWRCDTHPRASRDGRFVVIDSPHTGQGRQMHMIDVAGLTG